jgi:hypothetical protein
MVSARALLPSVIAMACVGAELALCEWGGAVRRPLLITALAGLAIVAVALILMWSMGLRRESIAARLVIAVPIVLSVALVVALMLDSDVRRFG